MNLSDFKTYLSFPSISTQPERKGDVLACCTWLKGYLEEMGLVAEQWETEGHPSLFAHNTLQDGLPTILFYLHYDVQPVDPMELWDSDPFEPVEKDGHIYARGTADNKGQAWYTFEAIKAFMAEGSGVNIKLIIEGEEECGSAGLIGIVDTKKAELSADYTVFVDSGIYGRHDPAVTMGLKGIVTWEVTMQGSDGDLHSGSMGGVALNPLKAMCQMFSRLWDEKGHVAIPGFYEGVGELDREGYDFATDMEQVARDAGVTALGGEEGFTYTESNWLRPILEINGMWGGYTDPGFKTVIPAKAHAKLSCRMVAEQDHTKIGPLIQTYLEKMAPEGLAVTVEIGECSPAVRSDPNARIAEIAADSYKEVFKKPCLKVLLGGTIPVAHQLVEASGGEFLAIGVALVSDNVHAPNERMELARMELGRDIVLKMLQRISNDSRCSKT